MKIIDKVVACVAIGLLVVACQDEQKPGPAELEVQPAAEDLIGLLPNSALAVVELLNLDSRWEELRAIAPLARVQDHGVGELGLDADEVPVMAGPQMVLAFVSDDAARRIVPVVVLDPPSPADALKRLSGSDGLTVVEARGAIWAGPAAQARSVERIAAGDGTSIRTAVDFEALAARLPAGGLVRVVLNPGGVRAWLLRWAQYEGTIPAAALARLLAADLEAIEVAGFRREIIDGELVTDMWVGIDGDVVPEAFVRALAADRGPALLPPDLPGNALVAKSFRTEPEAGLAWLRALAARDPDGPLRNLDFWINEFEERTGRSVEADIVDALGERGLALLLESESAGSMELVAIVDADDPERLEAALIDLRDWLAEQIWGRSLGLAAPRLRDDDDENGAVHGLDFWSPLGSLSGPVFQLVDGRLVVATGRESLDLGVELAGSAATWTTPAWALVDGPPDEIAVLRTDALARALIAGSGGRHDWLAAAGEFLAQTSEGRLRVDYDPGGFSMTGWIRLGGAGS
jgi:hypothetical protein